MIGGRHGMARVAAIILVVVSAAYANSLPNSFTFDDHPIVENNPVIHAGSWSDVLTSPFWPGQADLGLYRPVTTASLALNARLVGPSPAAFRVVNVILHGLTALLLYVVVTRLCGQGPGLAAAIVFATHPVHTEAVNAVVGRAELLAGLFFLAAWIAFRRGESDVRWRVASAACYALACLSKEHAIVLPAVIAIEDLLCRHDGSVMVRFRAAVGSWPAYLPLAAAAVAVLVARYAVIGAFALPRLPDFIDNPFAHAGSFDRIVSGIAVLARYVRLLLLPVDLSVDYTFDQVSVASVLDPYFLVGFALFAAVVTIGWRAMKGEVNELVALGGLVFLVAWLPVSNIPFPIGTPMNERLLYLPSFGFAILAGVGYGRLCETPGRVPAWVVAACLCLLFAGRAAVRNADWRNDFTLFEAAVEASPNSAKAFFNLGNALLDRGNAPGALDAYARALAIYPGYAEVHFNRGVLLRGEGEVDRAVEAYRKALDADADHVGALVNLGILMAGRGAHEEATALLKRAADAAPDRADVRFNLGVALEEVDGEAAVGAYRSALALNPGYEDAALNLARLMRANGQRDASFSVYRQLLAANPGATRAAYNFAVDLESAGRTREAIDAYRLVWAGGGEVGAYARLRMGRLFAKSGQPDSARVSLEAFKQAWRGDPKQVEQADTILRWLPR